jgi:cobalamin biosynthetic protein CobC
MMSKRDHGGGLDAAVAAYGGTRADWLDLSTGINPVPYAAPAPAPDAWTALPDIGAFARIEAAARRFWAVPDGAMVLATSGASAAIAQLPRLRPPGRVAIPGPTYNEHAAAFRSAGWTVLDTATEAHVAVHPNNPDGRLWSPAELTAPFTVIDESFCDVMPDASHIALASRPGTVLLKSFGKFWGLAGLRLGFAIGDPALIAPLADALGPWQVSGPALHIGAIALADTDWAARTRRRLASDTVRLDALLSRHGAEPRGGTTLFRLYRVADAAALQDKLARGQVWSRIFPYAQDLIRLGLPHPDRWHILESAL